MLLRSEGFIRPTAAAFTPASIGVHWWDAQLSTKTGSPGAISQINDLIGSLHLTQATGASQPADNTRTINGLVALDFDGADSLGVSSAPSFTTAFHIFTVCKFDALVNDDLLIDSGPQATVDTNDGMSCGCPGSNASLGGFRLRVSNNTGADALVAANGTVGTTVQHLVEVYSVGTTKMGITVDGVNTEDTTITFGCTSPDSFTIMARSPASNLNGIDGAWCMTVVCNQEITGSNLTSMRSYCQTRWGTP